MNIEATIAQLSTRPGDIICVTIPEDSTDKDVVAVVDAFAPFNQQFPDVFVIAMPPGVTLKNMTDAELDDIGLKRVEMTEGGK